MTEESSNRRREQSARLAHRVEQERLQHKVGRRYRLTV